MAASNPPIGTTAAFLDTKPSGIHMGNMNSNSSNGINQRNRGASVMNAQHGYQVKFGGNLITGSTGGITGQGGNRVSVQGGGGQSPLGLGGVGQTSSTLSSEQDPHPSPPQPEEHNQPFSSPPQKKLYMEY